MFSDGYATQLATIAAGGSVANSYAVSLQVGIAGPAVVANAAVLDIDRNGAVEGLTDGLMILRYLFGLRGDALTAGVLGAGATTRSAGAIESHLAALVAPQQRRAPAPVSVRRTALRIRSSPRC